MEKPARLAALAAAGSGFRRPGASLWLRDEWGNGRNANKSEGQYVDGDRNGNLRHPAGRCDRYTHGQLGPLESA
jgi:hypothetical protein